MAMNVKKIAVLAAVAGAGYWLLKGSKPPTDPKSAMRVLRPFPGGLSSLALGPGGSAAPTTSETSSQTGGVAKSTTLSGTCFADHALASRKGLGSLG